MLGAMTYAVKTGEANRSAPSLYRRDGPVSATISPQVHGIIPVRLHTNRGNPVISSEGESCAIQIFKDDH
jgi:hypothetical protein